MEEIRTMIKEEIEKDPEERLSKAEEYGLCLKVEEGQIKEVHLFMGFDIEEEYINPLGGHKQVPQYRVQLGEYTYLRGGCWKFEWFPVGDKEKLRNYIFLNHWKTIGIAYAILKAVSETPQVLLSV